MKTVAIGDIHGRPVWKQIIELEKPDRVVFVGDYFDPKINICVIQGCSSCKEALAKLAQEGILYNKIDANQQPRLADSLELMLKTSYYPIIFFLQEGKVYYFVSALSEEKVLDNETRVVKYYSSIPNLIFNIKSMLYA